MVPFLAMGTITNNTMKTKENIVYKYYPYGEVVIPKGTKVIPATNLPATSDIKYWCEAWDGIEYDNIALSWHRNYGFGLTSDEVVED